MSKHPVLFVAGCLMEVVGFIWIFQGVGVIKGSFMTGDLLWTFVGAVLAIAALAIFWYINRPVKPVN